MGEVFSLAASTVLILAVTWLIVNSNQALRHLVVLPFNPLLVPAENAFKAILLAFAIGLMALSDRPVAAYGLVAPDWRDLQLGAVLGLTCLGSVNGLSALAIGRWGSGISSSLVIRAIVPRHLSQWPAVALAMALAVALEEVLFRALPIGRWSPPLPVWGAIVLSAILFGLLHSVQGKLGLVLSTALGGVLGLALWWSGSLWVPLIAHYLFNMVQVAIAVRWPTILNDHAAGPASDPVAASHQQQ